MKGFDAEKPSFRFVEGGMDGPINRRQIESYVQLGEQAGQQLLSFHR